MNVNTYLTLIQLSIVPGDGLTTILKEFTTSEIKWCIAPRQLILASRITVFRSFKIA